MRFDLLDHGYLELIEPWGTGRSGKPDHWTPGSVGDYEVGIIEAARQSTQGAFRGWEYDEKLLGFLYNHRHSTPFEFAGMTLEIKAPIMVFREWQRHRTQAYNEASARYAPLPAIDYVPEFNRVMLGSSATTNKQAQGTGAVLTEENATKGLQRLSEHYTASQILYQDLLDMGWPKELARLPLAMGRYSQMRATCSLRNWLAFMTLRCDPEAQWEIRMYADAVAKVISETFPHTFKFWAQDFYGQ